LFEFYLRLRLNGFFPQKPKKHESYFSNEKRGRITIFDWFDKIAVDSGCWQKYISHISHISPPDRLKRAQGGCSGFK
jgi:hypothetical protein